MRFDVPLLPVSVDLRWRNLPPLQFSTRRLLALVVVVAAGCGLVAELRRHARAVALHYPQSFAPHPDAPWHALQRTIHESALLRIEPLLLLYVSVIGTVTLAFLAGRSIAGVRRRRVANQPGRTTSPRPADPAG